MDSENVTHVTKEIMNLIEIPNKPKGMKGFTFIYSKVGQSTLYSSASSSNTPVDSDQTIVLFKLIPRSIKSKSNPRCDALGHTL